MTLLASSMSTGRLMVRAATPSRSGACSVARVAPPTRRRRAAPAMCAHGRWGRGSVSVSGSISGGRDAVAVPDSQRRAAAGGDSGGGGGDDDALRMVYEDDDVLVIYKPTGLAFHASAEGVGADGQAGEPGVMQRVRAMQGDEIPYTGALYPVHRLDRVTSGLLVLAKSEEANRLVSEEFKQRRVHKYYVALSEHKPKKKMGTVKGDMKRSRRASWMLQRSTTNPAVTRLACVDVHSDDAADPRKLWMFVLKPQTGKTHQLRVAMKSLGSPILGDPTYSAAEENQGMDRTYLHATALRFKVGERIVQVVQPPTYGEFFVSSHVQAALGEWFPSSLADKHAVWFPDTTVSSQFAA